MSITNALIAKKLHSIRVNIYFGLQAYNAPFPVIIAYLVYISALIISVSVYHFRWHREGRTMRGERRIQVQDFLLGEDDKKGEKRNSLNQPLLSLVSKKDVIVCSGQKEVFDLCSDFLLFLCS